MDNKVWEEIVDQYLKDMQRSGGAPVVGVGSSDLLDLFQRMGVAAEESSGAAGTLVKAMDVLRARTPAATVTSAAQSSGGGVAGSIGKTVLKTFTSGLGLAPLVSGLIGLFGGGKHEEPPPLVKYALPPSLRIEAANMRGSGWQLADYGQSGEARGWSGARTIDEEADVRSVGETAREAGMNPQSRSAAPQITVQVQAMDSRSFLDHSQEIAQAVREAMLNMHSLNDVVSDL